MAHGPKDEPAVDTPRDLNFLFAFGRFVGFLLLAVPALAIVAAVVLLPAYQSMKAMEYQRDRTRAVIATYRDRIKATRRVIEEAPADEQLTLQVRMAQERLLPPNEVVVVDPKAPPMPPPGSVTGPVRPMPPPPSDALLSMAQKIQSPATKRGLFLLAAAAMLAAMFLFSPPEKYNAEKKER